ncbi:MarR family transcriptional regulator [Bacillus mangrovi]|uniref:MarR family transcriptional regulator n=1 Tax=Metabacillus mangrovi TaxID=1491830 RepID=A0A7X2V386_9BACI|nr:MarR family transcriptional regulator [Metabacillus mangrovi]MTH51778.1 MarR family transcriptional regulator [Metabacillus mangrovi]
MDGEKLKAFIHRYEEVYFFSAKRVTALVTEKVLEDITIEQYQILRYITMYPNCQAVMLADLCGVNKSAISAMVERLVQKGFVERVRDEKDRRNVFLVSTNKGRDVYEKGEQQIQKFVADYLTELTEAEIDGFLSVFEKIYASMAEKERGMKHDERDY